MNNNRYELINVYERVDGALKIYRVLRRLRDGAFFARHCDWFHEGEGLNEIADSHRCHDYYFIDNFIADDPSTTVEGYSTLEEAINNFNKNW